MATDNNSCRDDIHTLTDPDQSDGTMEYDFDERIGMEIDSDYIYLSAYDKKNEKPVLLQNDYGQTRTPISVSFTDNAVLTGDSAFNRAKTDHENSFQGFNLLLGENPESTICQGYARYRNHALFKRDNRCLLLIPSREQYVTPEELLGLLLAEIVDFASKKYKQRFSPLTLALSFQELQSEKKVRTHAEAATLAGLGEVCVVPRAAGQANESFHGMAWYHHSNPGPMPFIVIDCSLVQEEISLVVVDGKVTSVEASTNLAELANVDVGLKWSLHHLERLRDCRLVGLIVNGCSSSNDSFRSQLVSCMRDVLAELPMPLRIRDVEDRGAACQGIVYDSKKRDAANLILGKTGYAVELAVAPNVTGGKDSIRLFGCDVNLPCNKSISLTLASAEQHGVLLCVFTRDDHPTAGINLMTEVAIEFPKGHQEHSFTLDAVMSSNHELNLILRSDPGHNLASIHYSIDGAVSSTSAHLVPITPRIRREWLPISKELLISDMPTQVSNEAISLSRRNADKGDRDQ